MLWKEIKSWAKANGYECSKDENGYLWSNKQDPKKSGHSASVSKLARDIFNNITDNQFVEHQTLYRIHN